MAKATTEEEKYKNSRKYNFSYLDPVEKVSLGVSDLEKSITYWEDILEMKLYERSSEKATLAYGDAQCKLELVHVAKPVEHGTAFGRIAFSCPGKELPELEKKCRDGGYTVLTPLVRLDTPGKAAVEVVILADVVRLEPKAGSFPVTAAKNWFAARCQYTCI